jgi:hypothetical protein
MTPQMFSKGLIISYGLNLQIYGENDSLDHMDQSSGMMDPSKLKKNRYCLGLGLGNLESLLIILYNYL